MPKKAQKSIFSLACAAFIIASPILAEPRDGASLSEPLSSIERIRALRPKLIKAAEGLPETCLKAMLSSEEIFLGRFERALRESGGVLALVDKAHRLDPDYIPPDLVRLAGYALTVSKDGLQLRKTIMPAVKALDQAARTDGVSIMFSSAYRSYEYQNDLFEKAVARDGEEEAAAFTAKPGHSQHQLGTAFDLGSITDEFAVTKAGRWMAANAGEYGFSLSYPKGMEAVTGYNWESWHYRYIGVEACRLAEDYFGGVQQYLLEFIDSWRRLP